MTQKWISFSVRPAFASFKRSGTKLAAFLPLVETLQAKYQRFHRVCQKRISTFLLILDILFSIKNLHFFLYIFFKTSDIFISI